MTAQVTAQLIPITKARAITGFAPDTLHRINANEAPGILRKRGTGCGTRWYVYLPAWNQYTQRLPAA